MATATTLKSIRDDAIKDYQARNSELRESGLYNLDQNKFNVKIKF
jgi:hypothetical protein